MKKVSRRAFQGWCAATLAASAWAQSKPISVVLLMSGVITDGGWSQLAYEGLKTLAGDHGFKTSFAENINLAQMQEVIRGYADDGYNLLIGHGDEFTSALLDIAPDYPHQNFFTTAFLPQPVVPANSEFINLGYFKAAYGAGTLAALISERRQVVGFVGGEDDPTQQKIRKAFIAGAHHAVPGIQALGIITGDYDNAAKGREAASTLVGNGADVIWHAADVTGLGAIQGAVAGKAKVMGCYSDQTSLAPAYMATSFEMNLNGMVQRAAHAVANGSFAGGTEWKPPVDWMWLLKAGSMGNHNPQLVSPTAWAGFQAVWRDLASGKIDVSPYLA